MKMNSKRLLLMIFLAAFSSGIAVGQVSFNKVGQSTMNFQLVSISPAASAMGEAYTAVGTGADAMFFNPAAMAEMNDQFNVSLDYTQWIADINYYAGGIAWNLKNYGAVGLSFMSVDYGTIYGTSLNPLGGYIDNGPISNVGAYSIGLTYAKYINTRFLFGGSIRFVGQNLGENTFNTGVTMKNDATKLAFDLGVKYITSFHDFRFGMSFRNFSSDITRNVYPEQLPVSFTMGAAIDLMGFVDEEHDKGTALTLAADFLHTENYSERFNLGLEYKFLGMLALRGGYQTNRDLQSWSAGVGVNTTVSGNDIQINYSYSKMQIFNGVNRLSLVMSF
jgi:hypothetical protein